MSGIKNLNQGWGGQIVSPPANQGQDGTQVAPFVRDISRKYSYVVWNQPVNNTTFVSPWNDSVSSGCDYVSVTAVYDTMVLAGANGMYLEETDYPPSANATSTVQFITAIASAMTISGTIRRRYYRVRYVNAGAGSQTQLSITATESNAPPAIPVSSGGGVNPGGLLLGGVVQIGDGVNFTWGPLSLQLNTTALGTIQGGPLTTQSMLNINGNISNGWVLPRTPANFVGGMVQGPGAAVIWQPAVGNKYRLMRYKIEASEDVTISGGPKAVNVAFATRLTTATGALISATYALDFQNRFVAPASALATSGYLYDSDWIDLGNGSLSQTATQPLICGLQVAQSTAAVTPTFTIASNQWEAATIGFKTYLNQGAFRLFQSTTGNGTGTAVTVAKSMRTGSLVVVAIRTTNSGSGIPAYTVTDTAGNTYTVATKVTNATDGANGSSITFAYSVNITGNSANVITVTTTNSPTAILAYAFEYRNCGTGGIDSAQVGATGNSTSPSSGAYTPGTTGDLILTMMGTSVTLGSAPTVDSNFEIRGQFFSASGSMSIADNFGNGQLSAGVVNVVMSGTEE
jgi:hypothetical protein